jgi:hypothetical protein
MVVTRAGNPNGDALLIQLAGSLHDDAEKHLDKLFYCWPMRFSTGINLIKLGFRSEFSEYRPVSLEKKQYQ